MVKTQNPQVCAISGLFLLQQGRDVDVPAYGLAIKAAGEEVASRVIFAPDSAAHHSAVALKLCPKKERKLTYSAVILSNLESEIHLNVRCHFFLAPLKNNPSTAYQNLTPSQMPVYWILDLTVPQKKFRYHIHSSIS